MGGHPPEAAFPSQNDILTEGTLLLTSTVGQPGTGLGELLGDSAGVMAGRLQGTTLGALMSSRVGMLLG